MTTVRKVMMFTGKTFYRGLFVVTCSNDTTKCNSIQNSQLSK